MTFGSPRAMKREYRVKSMHGDPASLLVESNMVRSHHLLHPTLLRSGCIKCSPPTNKASLSVCSVSYLLARKSVRFTLVQRDMLTPCIFRPSVLWLILLLECKEEIQKCQVTLSSSGLLPQPCPNLELNTLAYLASAVLTLHCTWTCNQCPYLGTNGWNS
jgi:hypothetical protein